MAVLDCVEVAEDWHARFSCIGRSYEYVIANRRAPLVLEAARAWRIAQPLDADAMHEAAGVLVGHHDFTTFRSVHCQSASPVKTLRHLSVRREGDHVIVAAEARSFLHHQVRSMVGCLALVGEGRWSVADLRDALEAFRLRSEHAASIDAATREVLAQRLVEEYGNPNSGIGAYSAALGLTPRPASYTGPHNLWDYLTTVPGAGTHGEQFVYRTPNTDVLAWIITRVESKPFAQVLSERLWQPLGMLGDADLIVDEAGAPFAGGSPRPGGGAVRL